MATETTTTPTTRHDWQDVGHHRAGPWHRCTRCGVERLLVGALRHASFYARSGRYLGSTCPPCEPLVRRPRRRIASRRGAR